jgi:hypothetical protein
MISWIRERKKWRTKGTRAFSTGREQNREMKMIEEKKDYEGNDRRNESRYAGRRKKKWRSRSTQQSTTHKSRCSTVRDSPLTGVLSGIEASIPALLYVWAENSFLCSTGPFGLISMAAPGCFRKYWVVVGRLVVVLRAQKCWCFRTKLCERRPGQSAPYQCSLVSSGGKPNELHLRQCYASD